MSTVFDKLFGRVARHSTACRVAAAVFAAVHVACACAETGFLVHGWYSERLARVWFVPEGDVRTYAIVVGLPCAAFALLVLATLTPRVREAHPRIFALPVGLVMAICYVENLCYAIGEWKLDAFHVASAAYYLLCVLFLAHSVALYRIVLKKPTVSRDQQEQQQQERQEQQKQHQKK